MSDIDVEERVFDWVPRFDERSKAYPIRAFTADLQIKRRNKLWRLGEILDQEREGSCVGHAWTAELLSTPVAVNLALVKADVPKNPRDFARFTYREAQKIDEWEGESYEGTSVLAGAKVLKHYGFVKEFRWAFSIEDVIDTILVKGPVVVGTYWYRGMGNTNSKGFITPTGSRLGGHAYTIEGYELKADGFEDAFVIQNSWGNDWGTNGTAKIKVSDMERLLIQERGEACVPFRRSYGR